MKQTLLTICLIVFALPSWGNNISDFKIDGLGIGDSLLEFMTQDEIIQSSSASVYSSDKVKFSDVSILEHSVFSNKEKIWNFSSTIKKDRKFVIEGISLSEGYDTYDECLKRFNEFTKQIDYLFPKIKPKEYRNDEDEIIQKVYIFQKWFKGDAEIYYTCQPGYFFIVLSSSELVSGRNSPLWAD